jgi:hypothetical protein
MSLRKKRVLGVGYGPKGLPLGDIAVAALSHERLTDCRGNLISNSIVRQKVEIMCNG